MLSRDGHGDTGRTEERSLFRVLEGLLTDLGAPSARLSLNADLESDLGLGSIERAELLTRVERTFSVTLPDQALTEAETPAQLLEHVTRALEEGAESTAQRLGKFAVDGEIEEDRIPHQWQVPASVRTLVDMARFRAEVEGHRPHLFLVQDDGRERSLSFAELWQRALRVGAALTLRDVQRGDRIALMLPTGEDFFIAFLGVLAAGCVPVPIYPPVRLDQLGSHVDRYSRVLGNAEAVALLCDRLLRPAARLLQDRLPGLRQVTTVDSLSDGAAFDGTAASPEELALIQYTSGSTGDPKGVALRHRNLMANMRAIGLALAFEPGDVAVSWLPLYHDMGLIGVWLSCFLHGLGVVVLSPLQFLSRPERWLWAFHRHRGTVAPAPNFGYELCVRKIRDESIEGLDLSSWRSAMNGSEPVRVETVERFCTRFAPFGFRREAMMPVYGLAETSVAITFPPLGREPRIDRIDAELFRTRGQAVPADDGETQAFVSCGAGVPDHEVRVVDPEDPAGEPLPERREGKILFRGPSTMAGYFRRPEASQAIRIGEWVDTGDLGYLADGELFVTGRVKELVIKGGRKYHPHDIESAAQKVEGVRSGCVAAFSVPHADTGEAIVVLAETRRPGSEHPRLREQITAAVQTEVGTPPDRVLILPPGTIPKTSSGKLRRRESRTLYLEERLSGIRSGLWRQLPGLIATGLRSRSATGLKRAGQILYGVYADAVGLSLLSAGLLLLLLCPGERSALRLQRLILRTLAAWIGLKPRLRGEPLPAGPAILVSNHASNLDSLLLLLALERPVVFPTKKEVFSWPLVGRLASKLGHIPVDRVKVEDRLATLTPARQAFESGRLVHFFPEATFTPAIGLRSFRLGAFQLAAELGAPVVPIALKGTRAALRDGQWLLRRRTLEVELLTPRWIPEGSDFRTLAAVRDEVRRELAGAVGEPLLEVTSAAIPGLARDTSPAAGTRKAS